jgi:hypothetical protein
MLNGIQKLYAFAVCFMSLTCGAITAGFFLFNLVKWVAPEATVDPAHLRPLISNDAFIASPYYVRAGRPTPFALMPDGGRPVPVPQPREQVDQELPSEADIREMRRQQRDTLLESHRFRARQGMILQAIILLICLPLFVVHWRLAGRFTQ